VWHWRGRKHTPLTRCTCNHLSGAHANKLLLTANRNIILYLRAKEGLKPAICNLVYMPMMDHFGNGRFHCV